MAHGDRGHDPSRFRILSIDDEIPFAEGGNSLPINLQRLVKGIRTDLDSFSDQEIVFLVQHGYAVARHALTVLSEECRQLSGEKPKLPIVQLMRTAKDVPTGRWLPPRTEPGWPRDKDQSAWDNDSDKVKLTKSIASLKHSGDIRLRLFSLRDHVSLVTLACVLAFALTVGTCGVLLRARASAIPHILYSNLGGNLDTTLFEVDPSMPGVEISERVVGVDIRNEVPVREADLDNLRVSPSVHTYTIKGVRRETTARYLVYEFSSQRRLMDAVCITPQRFQVRYRQDPAPGGDGFDNVYTIIISLDQQSPDIPFNVTFRMTRWNAYQASNNNYVGALVSGDENLVRLNVLLPHGRHYRSANVQERPQKAGAKWTDVDAGRASMPVPTSDKTGFTWTLQSPRKGWAHRAMIVWD